jgi:hypothetical protein
MLGWRRGHVAPMGEKRNAYRILSGKPEGRENYKVRIFIMHILRHILLGSN